MAQARVTRRSLIGGAGAGVALSALPDLARPGTAQARDVPHSTDVVVIGAGLAGLTAARTIAQAGRSVVVLEARHRVGGRTLNHHLGPQGFPGRVIEVGGQWVGPLPGEPATSSVPGQAVYWPQSHVYKLARTLGIGTYKTYNKGEYIDYSSVTGRTRYSSSTRIP